VLSALRIILVLGLSVLFAACGEAPTEPSHFAPFARSDLRLGAGDEATAGRTVRVHYTLWLYSATVADNKGVRVESSVGQTPFAFTLGSGEVIQGWNEGVTGMRVGGLRRLVVPPSLGYGEERNGVIPPNATLLFEIELLDVTT
jgi:FKBP-type peptidyl-prolyl cis-trans isomerase FkpA